MTLQWVLGWWNLVFLAPFLIAITYLGVYVTTGITFGDADVDADADADVHADVHADVDHDIDADHDLDTDADADADQDQDAKSVPATTVSGHGFSVLDLLGVGRVPLSLLVMIFLFSWSISGFAAVQWMHQSMSDGGMIALYALPIAAFVAMASTSALSRLFGSVIPMREAPARGLTHLIGQRGVAVLPISNTFGLASITMPGSAAIQVACRVADGEPAIESNTSLVVLRLDRAERLFYVTTPDRLHELRSIASVP